MENNRNASSGKFRPRWGKPVVTGVQKQEAEKQTRSSNTASTDVLKKKFRPRWGQPLFIGAPQSGQAAPEAFVNQTPPLEDSMADQKVKEATMAPDITDREIIEPQVSYPNDTKMKYGETQPQTTARDSLRNVRTWAVAAVVCLCVVAGYWYYQAQHAEKTVPEIAASTNADGLSPVQEARLQQETHVAPEVAIQDLLMTWLKSWQSADIQMYSGFYAPDFKAKGMDLNAWISHKTMIFKKSKNISVNIENVKIAVDGNSAMVEFTQHYSSSIAKSSDKKTLKLKKIGNDWKIYSEIS